MALSPRTLALIAACGVAAACAHAPAAQLAQGPAFPALGEDMPDDTLASARPQPATKLFSIDTPVGKLCSTLEGRAVIDRDMPGLTGRPEFPFFKHMSLRQLQAASNGKMSTADLAKVSLDLSAIASPAATPFVRAIAALP